MKLLTIIVPTYNMEKLLRRGLDSLILPAELMPMLEVLVVNDGSKDSSSEIAHEYQDRYPQTFRVIDKENGNYGSCINRGLAEVAGRYVRVLDADDTLDTASLAELLRILQSRDVDMVVTEMYNVDLDGNITGGGENYAIPTDRMVMLDDVCYPDWLLGMACTTIRADIFRRIGYHQTEGVSYTDEQWVFAPINEVRTLYYSKIPLYRYLQGREGQTVETTTRLKRSAQVASVVADMVRTYNGMKPRNKRIDGYLQFRLHSLIRSLYEAYLLRMPTLDQQTLIDFDGFLRENNEQLYAYAGALTISPKIKKRYVESWRCNGHRPVNGFLILLDRCLNRLHSLKG